MSDVSIFGWVGDVANFASNTIDDAFYTNEEKSQNELGQSQLDALNEQTAANVTISNNNLAAEAERQKTYIVVGGLFVAAITVISVAIMLK